MPLYREVRPGDTLRIGDIEIVAERKSGQATRLRINTDLPIQHIKAGATPAAAPSTAPAPPRPVLKRPALAG